MYQHNKIIFPGKKHVLNQLAAQYGTWTIILLGLLLLLPGTSTIPLIDRDEPRFVEATRTMLETGEWFVPYFNGQYRFDKPILTYWVMAPGLWLAGNTPLPLLTPELGSRLHSVVSTILLGLVLFHMGRRWYSPLVGLIAGAGAISCFQLIMHGRSSVADMPMVLFVALAQWALFELLHPDGHEKPAARWFWTLYLSLGLGFLAKGPVAWLVPLLTILLYRWPLRRKPLPWRNLRLLPGLAIVLVIIGAWGIPALVKTEGLFWERGMGEHVFERGFSTMAGFNHFFFYYLLTAFISLFPWIAYGGFAISHLRLNWTDQNAFCVAWIASTYLFFSLYFTQLPHYVMPAFAAVFLILAQVVQSSNTPRRWARIWFVAVIALGFVLASIVLLFGLLAPMQPPFTVFRTMLIAAGIGMLALTLAGIAPRVGSPLLLVAMLAIAAGSLHVFARGFRETSITVQLPKALGTLPGEAELISSRFNEPGIVFYTRRNWQQVGEEPEWIAERMTRPGPRVLVLLENEKPIDYYFRTIWRERFGRDIRLRERDHSAENDALPSAGYRTIFLEGANPARTSWSRIRVLVKTE